MQMKRIAYEADMRKPLYSKRIYQNLTLDSIVFRNTLRYAAIMMIAIFIALMFDFEKHTGYLYPHIQYY